jgi:transcriptional regulator with XRE-family HTH domain|tara:strand:+ start:1019 stop:1261 length:243 start_codon:yes stop_codon:yes gene_type:complete
MITKEVSQASLAKRIGVSQPTLSRYISGDVLPNVVTALEIQKVTQGDVPVEAWLTIKDDIQDAIRLVQAAQRGEVVYDGE